MPDSELANLAELGATIDTLTPHLEAVILFNHVRQQHPDIQYQGRTFAPGSPEASLAMRHDRARRADREIRLAMRHYLATPPIA